MPGTTGAGRGPGAKGRRIFFKLRIRPIERFARHGHVCAVRTSAQPQNQDQDSEHGHYSLLTDFMTLIRWAQIAARFSFKWKLISSAKKKKQKASKKKSQHKPNNKESCRNKGKIKILLITASAMPLAQNWAWPKAFLCCNWLIYSHSTPPATCHRPPVLGHPGFDFGVGFNIHLGFISCCRKLIQQTASKWSLVVMGLQLIAGLASKYG